MSFVTKITVQSFTSSLVYQTRKILINISSLEIQAYVQVQVTKYSSERNYFQNWNFMLKTRTILIVSCRPGISLICSSSSYKIFNEKNIIFQIGILCRKKKKKIFRWNETVWSLGLTQNYQILFGFKLQDIQREEHYIPNWNFMVKTRTMFIDTCQPRISLLCSISSYKMYTVKSIKFHIDILCQRQKKLWQVVFLVGTVWCLGLLQETVWMNWIFFGFFIHCLIVIYCTRMETNWLQINHSTNKTNFLQHSRFQVFS